MTTADLIELAPKVEERASAKAGKAPAKRAPAKRTPAKAAAKKAPAKKAPVKPAPAKSTDGLTVAQKRAFRTMMANHLRKMRLTGLTGDLADVPEVLLQALLASHLKYIDPVLDKQRLDAWRAARAAAKK